MMKIEFFIEKQEFKTDQEKFTARVLLRDYAGEDPDKTTLVLKQGNDITKFKDDDTIYLKNGMHFVVFHDGPTPVSYFGPTRLIDELIKLGYEPKLVTAADNQQYVVLENFQVMLGRFVGRVIDLGILATQDYPTSVASAIHVKSNPQLFEKSDSVPNVRNITDSNLGSDWRYWSINFNWNNGFSARRLVSQINSVFQNA